MRNVGEVVRGKGEEVRVREEVVEERVVRK